MRVLASLLLLLVALVVCAGPAAAAATHHAEHVRAVECPYQTPTTLHVGDSEQVPRRDGDDPPSPAALPVTPVAAVPAGHADTDPSPPPERTLLGPSPVEQLCVDRN
ncbi:MULTISPECIES: hypothetical protein [unclassified Pseudonocardia]|uniref:hypothetical protein n=1 Tax=unclassified Pseudonocardia TaxID=2619320 RepID=UPI0001FFE2A7|nr:MULTISPECIES: hypothetical protein [unclassified Pseudonocardia]ALE74187.1 hypothetical protein FRP1_16330 [Pseudonocardia sp. EC080625-04]ALL77601.1 hypothetical protein AD006_23980 [Pseudonocardia sp. EC080610-09]ALL80517.1 hypothetical protein AD017_03570 [Pseudonocardia sp. EC080619-01]OLM17648.1 hypothetical protein Ae707Ps1_1907 [Pseudonocardia sp. Ae707_Ps1]